MSTLYDYAAKQYDAVKGSRKELLLYCRLLSAEELVSTNDAVGRGGSIRNLLVHIANIYELWIAKNVLDEDVSFAVMDHYISIESIEQLFKRVDDFMEIFLQRIHSAGNDSVIIKLNDLDRNFSLLELFTHVITHEFHHKGQILSLGRQLGYTPVDTDIIR